MRKNLRVRKETGSRESSEKEEDAYKEDERQPELFRPPVPSPISLNRFGFHVDLSYSKCKTNANLCRATLKDIALDRSASEVDYAALSAANYPFHNGFTAATPCLCPLFTDLNLPYIQS